MRVAVVFFQNTRAGFLVEIEKGTKYRFQYGADYEGPSISAGLPRNSEQFEFDRFPPFFDGLLPEGLMLESLLKGCKLDEDDLFGQLMETGQDLVGAVTLEETDALPDNV
jgi:serine/threonine-protein kinase HipA